MDTTFPCSSFIVGEITIDKNASAHVSEQEIVAAMKRHTALDFGNVSYAHHCGNLQNIKESSSSGVVTSIYRSQSGIDFQIMTILDDFDPHTRILIR